MSTDQVLLMTDLVDSTLLSERLGDEAGAALWASHDHITRDLLHQWRGREIDKSDGFLVLFDCVEDGVACAQALHRALARMNPPLLARAGIHCGVLRLRPNRDEDIRHGAKPMEVDGLAKPLAARIMGLACGGQTLLSDSAAARLAPSQGPIRSHGHWRFKGLSNPIEVFEAHADRAAPMRPLATPKAYRVIAHDGQWLTLDDLPNNLPAERDGFVGRGEPLALLAAQFDSGARLVSLLGIGGIGKTRVALRYARGWLGDYPGGAWFCDLSAARGLDGIVQATAISLGLTPEQLDPVEKIGQAIAGRSACLVVLDNFEQVARHAEATLGRWLAAAPLARFLVTSREVLGIAGEQAIALAPMDAADATQLFAQRASAAHSGYRPDANDLAAVPLLMDLLDRLPLAIELAAARALVMPVHAMLSRMNQRFKLLAGRSGRQDRQATMRATLDWSWDLLAPAEQVVLAQMSVFEGGFNLESAEAVIKLDGFQPAPWVGDMVQGLVEKSLVRQRPGARLDLLRTVQDYAAEKLGFMDSALATEARHWQHFAGFDEQRATAASCADLDNLVIACRRATAARASRAVDALAAAWAALQLTGPIRTVIDLAGHLTDADGLGARDRMRVHGIMTSALLHLGDLDAADQHLGSGLALSEVHPEQVAERARLLACQAELQRIRGHYDSLPTTLTEALQLARRCAAPLIRLRLMNTAGSAALAQGRLDAAAQAFEEVRIIAQQLGDRRWEGGADGNLGIVRHEQGRAADAQLHYRRAVAVAQQVGDRTFEGNSRCNLGLLLLEQGAHQAAYTELDAALGLAQQIGQRRLEQTTRCNLGIVNEALGQAVVAQADYQLAITLAQSQGDQRSEGQFRGYLATLLARQGHHTEAGQQFQEARRQLVSVNNPADIALLDAQQAVTALLAGDTHDAAAWRAQAERAIDQLGLGAGSEAARLLTEARGLCA